MNPSRTALILALLAAGFAHVHAAGLTASATSTPLPRPPNPGNNPWLNYPTHYGPGATVHRFGENASPDRLAKMNRFMQLGEAARMELMKQGEQTSLARGRSLFGDARLGSNGLNCASCHPNGGTAGGKVGMGDHEIAIPSLVDVARRYPAFKAVNARVITLTDMQKNCIELFMQGKPLASGTPEAADLTHFVGNLKSKP
jgi:cytochrome c